MTVLIAGIGAIFGAGAATRFTPAGLEDSGSESSAANRLVARATGDEPIPGFIVVFPTGLAAKSSKSKGGDETKTTLEQLSVALRVHHMQQAIEADRDVAKVKTALDVGVNFVSRNTTLTYITVQFHAGTERQHVEAARRLAARLSHRRDVKLGGSDLVTSQASDIINKDARRAELLAFPLLLLLLLWFFRGLIAAALPLVLGATAIVLTQAGLRLATAFLSISELVLIVVTALGLGLAIDYSLLIVSRFREELARNPNVPEALESTMTTAGRTVLFSSLTVVAAFASLLVFPEPFFYSIGLGGGLVTAIVSIAALTVLPAFLALLGPRVNGFAPKWLQLRGGRVARPILTGRWYKLAMAVMRRPALVAVCAATVLVGLSLPMFGVKLTIPSMSTMPDSTSVRQVSDTLDSDFKIDPAHVSEIVSVDATRAQLASYRKRLHRLPGITAVFPVQHLKLHTALFYVSSSYGETSNSGQVLVRHIRTLPSPFQTKVTGATAVFIDLKASLAKHLLLGALLVVLTTCLTIFLLTGSVVLPLKALLMNTLTAAATIGVLVLVFQEGFLHQLLGYPSVGAIEITQPVTLIAIIFGVSTDYGVFLIDRIREAHDAGSPNELAIASGLERTGRITSAAALLLCVAVGSLLTSRIVAVREVALGLSVAVLLDATVVRALLVPALMQILGERNWWSPAPLRRIHARVWGAPTPVVELDSPGRQLTPPDQQLTTPGQQLTPPG